MRQLISKAQVVVAPLAFDAWEYAQLPETCAPADLPRVLFLSRIHPKKRLEKFIAACALLRYGSTPVALGIVGDGETAYVERLQAEAHLLKIDAEFLGMVSGAEKIQVLRSAEVFCLPTLQENFGLALIEAMACGTPVITTKGVGIWPELEQTWAQVLEVNATPMQWAEAMGAAYEALYAR